MDYFDVSHHFQPELDINLLEKVDFRPTEWIHEEPNAPPQIDTFLDSGQIQCDPLVMLYTPEEDSPISSHGPRSNPPKVVIPGEAKRQFSGKRMKNSNAIKKIGRIILDRLSQYELPSGKNVGIKNMLERLGEHIEAGRRPDSFNTSHMQALFETGSKLVTTFNLCTTRKIFSRQLRREVFSSRQLKGESRLVYLNTFKCSSLRFMNCRLASRLQASESQ